MFKIFNFGNWLDLVKNFVKYLLWDDWVDVFRSCKFLKEYFCDEIFLFIIFEEVIVIKVDIFGRLLINE